MRRYLVPMLLALATAAWPGMAGAMEFTDQTTGPPVATTNDGFVEVLGPEATEPEHAGDFVGPLPEYMQPAPGSDRAPNGVQPPPQQPRQR